MNQLIALGTDGPVSRLSEGNYKQPSFRTPSGWPNREGRRIEFNGVWYESFGGYLLGNGKRLYLPSLARFVSPDPVGPFQQGNSNVYAYAAADPVNRMDGSGLAWMSKIARFIGYSPRPPQASKAMRNFMRAAKAKLGDPRTAIQHYPVDGTGGIALKPYAHEVLYIGHAVGGENSNNWKIANKKLADKTVSSLSAEEFSARIKPYLRDETTMLTLWSCRLAGSDYLQRVSNNLGVKVRGFDNYIKWAGADKSLGFSESASPRVFAKPPFLHTWNGYDNLKWHTFHPSKKLKK